MESEVRVLSEFCFKKQTENVGLKLAFTEAFFFYPFNPKSSFDWRSKANQVTPLNAADDDDFADSQEMLEATLAGRGTIEGAGYVEGGLRGETLDVKK